MGEADPFPETRGPAPYLPYITASKVYWSALKAKVLVVVAVARVVGDTFSRASGMISAKEIQIMHPAAKPAKKGKREENTCTKA